jgi:glycosyltransferase involved in cell wall biosynthesis
LAIIKGTNHRKSDFFDLYSLQPYYINDERISSDEVNKILNMSYTGGIYSAEEGGCYSSSEYLLCGLPVVSCFSKGGRDTWFNNYNSIIVENDDPLLVKDAVNELKNKIISGELEPEKIRNQHITKQMEMRERFVLDLSKRIDAEISDVCAYFENTYQNKLVRYNEFLEI